jgi:hypothetical protein
VCAKGRFKIYERIPLQLPVGIARERCGGFECEKRFFVDVQAKRGSATNVLSTGGDSSKACHCFGSIPPGGDKELLRCEIHVFFFVSRFRTKCREDVYMRRAQRSQITPHRFESRFGILGEGDIYAAR